LVSTIPFLSSLQDIDLALDAQRKVIDRARAELDDQTEVVEARRVLEEAQERLRDLAGLQREREFEVDDIRAKVGPLEAKLYGGTIKSPKELAELDHQVNTFKEMLAERESALLEQITATEGVAGTAETLQGALDRLLADRKADTQRLGREIAESDAIIKDLEAKRATAAALIDAAVLHVYSQIRPRTGGRAVARVERGMCGGCRISLPMNVVNRARGGWQLVQCTSCQRILLGS